MGKKNIIKKVLDFVINIRKLSNSFDIFFLFYFPRPLLSIHGLNYIKKINKFTSIYYHFIKSHIPVKENFSKNRKSSPIEAFLMETLK